MTRVLHVVGHMDPGGTETLLMNLYRQLDRSTVQFDFLVHSPLSGYFDDEIRSLGGRIFRLQEPQIVTLPSYAMELHRLLNQYGPFAGVHSHVYAFSGFVLHVARRLGVPLRIAHSHSTGDGKPGGCGRSFYRRLMRMLISRNATHLLACSRSAGLALYGDKALSDPRVSVFPNAINLRPYRNLPFSKQALRRELSLPADEPLIGHVGSFRPQKNHAFLIDLMAELLTRMPSAQLLLVGDGLMRADTERRVEEKGIGDHVHFLGIRSDVPRILGALDLFLFPSHSEGLGIVLIEAQAAGVPCITSDVIPHEADVGLGLIQSVSLEAGVGEWVDLIASQLRLARVPWVEREAGLCRAGYDIESLAHRLQRLYALV